MSLIGLDEAKALLLGELPALSMEDVPLDDALGRTLAAAIIATHDQPAERRATMDGIAVSEAEPAVGDGWRLVGEIAAGVAAAARLEAGQAARIATGAVIPHGADRVLPQEIVQFSNDQATLISRAGSARFIRQRGADFKSGERLLERGTLVDPAKLGLIAAANCSTVAVVRKPRIAICTAGDELVPPGSALNVGYSIDSATHALAALIRCWGGVPRPAPILPDRQQSISAAIDTAAQESEIVLCIGGASVGARDFMRPAARAIGAQFLFEGVAVQPGKPCWHARLKDGGFLLGLPGNPSSALVCAHLLLLPLIERMMGRADGPGLRTARLAAPLPANGDREQYLRATASLDGEGRALVVPVSDQDSGLQFNLAKAQVLIRRSAGAEPLDVGGSIEVLELTRY